MPLTNHFINQKRLDKISLPELQEEEMRLEIGIEKTRKDVAELEKQKKKTFNEGIEADFITRMMLAEKLKKLSGDQKDKFNEFQRKYKQYQFVSNLIVLKKHQKELEMTPLWSKLVRIAPADFETMLVSAKFSGKRFEDVLDNLNDILNGNVSNTEIELSEENKKLNEIWDCIRSGTLDAAEAENMFSLDKTIAQSLEKSEI